MNNNLEDMEISSVLPSQPEDAHRSIGRHLNVGLIHKHCLKTGVWIAASQDLLVELKNLMKVRHGVFE